MRHGNVTHQVWLHYVGENNFQIRMLTHGNEEIDHPISIEDYIDEDSQHTDIFSDEQNDIQEGRSLDESFK